MFIQKLAILRESFPDSWVRKSIFLLWPTDVIHEGNSIAGFLTKKGNEVILLCVAKRCRGRGIASKLLRRSKAIYAYTYAKNKEAIDVYLKNGFSIDSYKDSMFGRKVKLVRKHG